MKYQLTILALLLLIACFYPNEGKVISTSSVIQPHIVLPTNFDKQVEHPLVVWLMGHGGNHIDTSKVYIEIADSLNCVWIILRGDSILFENGYTWNNSIEEFNRIKSNIKTAIDDYNIDENQIALYGFNHEIAYKFGFENSEMFHGIMAFMSRNLNSIRPTKIKNDKIRVLAVMSNHKYPIAKIRHIEFVEHIKKLNIAIKLDTTYNNDIPCCYPANGRQFILDGLKWIFK